MLKPTDHRPRPDLVPGSYPILPHSILLISQFRCIAKLNPAGGRLGEGGACGPFSMASYRRVENECSFVCRC